MAVANYKTNLTQLLKKLNILRSIHNDLQDNPNSLKEKFEEIQNSKNEIETLLSECEKPAKILAIKKKLKRRSKKRQIIKDKKREIQKNIQKRPELHDKINKSLDIIKKNHLESLARKEAAEHAKLILTQINQKKSEALKYIQLIKSLRELRLVRKVNEQLADPVKNTWNEKSGQLLALWEDTLDEYLQEESKLKSLLAFNSKSLEDQWREVLFGDKEREKRVSKVFCLFEFFNIRQTWDSFIVPEQYDDCGSTIPIGWALPPEHPTNEWSSYLFK